MKSVDYYYAFENKAGCITVLRRLKSIGFEC